MSGLTVEKVDSLPCGHHKSLAINSAETGEFLYCDLCDCRSARNDAERMETELRAELAALSAERGGEPVAWMNPYGGTLQVRITGLEYEKYTIPLYTAPPAQAVDVDAISDEAMADARRYRRLFDCPEPFCYRGEVFETKVVADNAIDTDMRKTP